MNKVFGVLLLFGALSGVSFSLLLAQAQPLFSPVLIDGEDPVDWPPEKVFETRLNFAGGTDLRNRQRFYLDQIIDGNPTVYAPMAAKVLETSTDPYHLGLCAEYVRAHPDPDVAREAVLNFLKRSDSKQPRDAVEVAANSLVKVGKPEDAQWLLPYFEGAGLTDRHSLWRSIAGFAGIEYYELMLDDIAKMEAERDDPKNAHRKTVFLAVLSALDREKKRYEERLGIGERSDEAEENVPEDTNEGLADGVVSSSDKTPRSPDAQNEPKKNDDDAGWLSRVAIAAVVCAVLVLVIFGIKKLGGGNGSASS